MELKFLQVQSVWAEKGYFYTIQNFDLTILIRKLFSL